MDDCFVGLFWRQSSVLSTFDNGVAKCAEVSLELGCVSSLGKACGRSVCLSFGLCTSGGAVTAGGEAGTCSAVERLDENRRNRPRDVKESVLPMRYVCHVLKEVPNYPLLCLDRAARGLRRSPLRFTATNMWNSFSIESSTKKSSLSEGVLRVEAPEQPTFSILGVTETDLLAFSLLQEQGAGAICGVSPDFPHSESAQPNNGHVLLEIGFLGNLDKIIIQYSTARINPRSVNYLRSCQFPFRKGQRTNLTAVKGTSSAY